MAIFDEKVIYDFINNKIEDENKIKELSNNADFMYEVIKRTGDKNYYLNCPQELKNNPDFARKIRTLFIRIRTTQIVSPESEENKANFDEVINYINGKITNVEKIDEYHNNPKFMLSVLRLTNNKNILKRCSHNLLHNEELINGVKKLFGDTPINIIHKLEIESEEKQIRKIHNVIPEKEKEVTKKEVISKPIKKDTTTKTKQKSNNVINSEYNNLFSELLDNVNDLDTLSKDKIKELYDNASDEQKYVAILMVNDYIKSRKVFRGKHVYKAYKYNRRR